MSLPAVSKHLKVLERAGLISRGRDAQYRPCRLEAQNLKSVDAWLDEYRRFWEERFDRLEDYLAKLQRKPKPKPQKKQERSHDRRQNHRHHPQLSTRPRALVFECWLKPEHLLHWYSAGGGWTTPYAGTDPRNGGRFNIGFAGPEGKTGFDFTGAYDEMTPPAPANGASSSPSMTAGPLRWSLRKGRQDPRHSHPDPGNHP